MNWLRDRRARRPLCVSFGCAKHAFAQSDQRSVAGGSAVAPFLQTVRVVRVRCKISSRRVLSANSPTGCSPEKHWSRPTAPRPAGRPPSRPPANELILQPALNRPSPRGGSTVAHSHTTSPIAAAFDSIRRAARVSPEVGHNERVSTTLASGLPYG